MPPAPPFALVLLNVAALALPAFAGSAPPLVPGYERLRSEGAAAQPEAGEVLLSELSCTACHREGGTRPSPLACKPGPDLSAVGNRLRARWLREFLASPSSAKPGTTMPDLLAAQPEARRAELAEDLTHFLLSRREQVSAREALQGSAEKGREIFQSVGCAACHADIPLQRLGEKYGPGELARFLEKPLKVRPGGRMPDLRLKGKDAAHVAAFLAPSPPPEDPPFTPDSARAERGGQAYASLGCVACHEGGGQGRPLQSLDVQQGCLAENPPPAAPRYPLSADQRASLRAALTARASQSASAETPQAAIRRLMLQRSCFACHARDGQGGPKPEAAVHFTSAKDDLGDLGRLPPPLDGVGRKFQSAALENILRGRDPVRRYMRVRMPDFGDELARALSALFADADADAAERPSLSHENPNLVGRNDWGREIVGTSGYACIACHDLHGHPSLGLGAYDLAEMPKRLRPEWMRDFLLNPAAFPTGSRMPAFWPDGKPVNAKLGGGTADRQIDSIRVYLTEADQSLPPEGMADRAAFELKPADRPIVFRTFIAGAGTHAIAVGFPGGVNAAFDALATRWSLAWRGRFLDADGTWNQRYAKMEKPLGDELVRIDDAGALSIAGHVDLAPRYRGYRLGAGGAPVFEYDLGELRVEDRIEPGPNRGLRRTLRVTGQPTGVLQFTANPPAGLKVRAPGGAPLPGQLEFHNGVAELVEEISW